MRYTGVMISLEKILQMTVVLVVVFFSAHLFFIDDPELESIASTDGVVRIEGLARQAQIFSIASPTSPTIASPLIGQAYHLLPDDEIFDVPVTISWSQAVEQAMVYRWDERWGYWAPLPASDVQRVQESLIITTDQLGIFALGSPYRVDAPLFLDALDELLAKAPVKAVAYRVALSATSEGGAPIVLNDAFMAGGCGGVPGNGREVTWSEVDRTAAVLVNDVMTPTTFHFIAQWENDDAGCAADSPLQLIENRATLSSSF